MKLLKCRASGSIVALFAILAILSSCGGNTAEASPENATPKDPKELVSEDNLVRLTQEMVRINSEFSKGVCTVSSQT